MNDNSARRGYEPLTTLVEEPQEFFMTLRDIAFWIRSARADASLSRLQASATPGEAFDRLYRQVHDPYASTLPQYRYQRRKYRALLSILPNRRYGEVLDIGCGLGVFSRALAPYAEQVLGIDVSSHAVAQARMLSLEFGNVRFEQGDIRAFEGRERFSLVVLADVIYYLSSLTDASVEGIAANLAALLQPRGLLLLVNHFFFGVDRASRMTRRVHNTFCKESRLSFVVERRRAFYLATVLERV